MFGKTYGKLTHLAASHDYRQPISPGTLFGNSIKETFLENPNKLTNYQTGFSPRKDKIIGKFNYLRSIIILINKESFEEKVKDREIKLTLDDVKKLAYQ